MVRANTEFVRTSEQMGMIKSRREKDPHQEKVRKSMQRLEAQKLADTFMDRVTMALELEELEDYTVEKHGGDLYRRFLAKVRIGEDDYVHLAARQFLSKKGWACQYAWGKCAEDPLMDHDPDYQDLPRETVCGAADACSLQ